MKRTKKESNHSCDFCKRDGIKKRADWMHYTSKACNEHKAEIKIDDGYMSEGDHQSWGRL